MNFKETYHIQLREKRRKNGWTQQETAIRVGISRSYYCDIENGKKTPSGKLLFKINEVLPIFLTKNDADKGQKEVSNHANR